MTPTRKKRLMMVLFIVLGVGAATAVALTTLKDNMLHFVSPTDVHEAEVTPIDRQIRLGGLVAANSVRRDADTLAIEFIVTDGRYDVPVSFQGILPDLFREGQGVIAHGHLDANGHFHANEVLARHDETYMPPEVMKSLEAAGHPAAGPAS